MKLPAPVITPLVLGSIWYFGVAAVLVATFAGCASCSSYPPGQPGNPWQCTEFKR